MTATLFALVHFSSWLVANVLGTSCAVVDFSSNARNAGVSANRRVDCYPEPGASQSAYQARGCIWEAATQYPGAPYCFYPANTGYDVVGVSIATLKRNIAKVSTGNPTTPVKHAGAGNPSCPFGADAGLLRVSTQTIGSALFVNIFNA